VVIKLEVRFKMLPAFTVLGIEGCGPTNEGNKWIVPLWEKARNQFHEIKALVKTGDSWGLMSDSKEYLARWKEEGKYLAGWEVAPGTKPPPGWTIWNVPEQAFAVSPCTFMTYMEVMTYVLREVLPKGGYEQAGAIHEFYPKEFQNLEKDSFYLYIPIK
jgi:predicted transcriptional regulator YdeE